MAQEALYRKRLSTLTCLAYGVLCCCQFSNKAVSCVEERIVIQDNTVQTRPAWQSGAERRDTLCGLRVWYQEAIEQPTRAFEPPNGLHVTSPSRSQGGVGGGSPAVCTQPGRSAWKRQRTDLVTAEPPSTSDQQGVVYTWSPFLRI